MNKGTAFVLGCLFGGAGGGFLAHTILKQKYAQKADEEIIACREAFQGELGKLREELDKHKAEKKEEDAKKASKEYGVDLEQSAPSKENEEPKLKRYEISEEIYNDPTNSFTKVSLLYFPVDNIMLLDDGSFMADEDVDEAIGLDALDPLRDEESAVDSIWYRNEKFQRDYEVTNSDISYAEWKRSHYE